MTERARALARLCWALDRRRWLLSLCNVLAALLFVVGSISFLAPTWYGISVTMFVLGSAAFLVAAVGSALVEHGPST